MTADISVSVAYSPAPRRVDEVAVQLPAGSTVAAAVLASGLLEKYPELTRSPYTMGVWNRKSGADTPLRERDRIEIYRPLKVDPKVARRERFAKQGAKKAGLFAKRRVGAKPGY